MVATAQHTPDGMTLIEVIRALEEDGYTAQLAPAGGGAVRCFVCRAESPASDAHVDRICRTEGPSDPDDMVAVAGVRCPRCGARGTLALKYGPGAPPEEAEILAHLGETDLQEARTTALDD